MGLYRLWEEFTSSPAALFGMLLVLLSVFSVDLIGRAAIGYT
jgi:hypothetical protein